MHAYKVGIKPRPSLCKQAKPYVQNAGCYDICHTYTGTCVSATIKYAVRAYIQGQTRLCILCEARYLLHQPIQQHVAFVCMLQYLHCAAICKLRVKAQQIHPILYAHSVSSTESSPQELWIYV